MARIIAHQAERTNILRVLTLAEPSPSRSQVRRRSKATTITFVDTIIRSGSPIRRAVVFPVVLGNGVGGIVDTLGEGVDREWSGARVVTSTGGTGGYASAALASVSDLHRVPDGLGLHEATALLADGRTAVGLHDAAGIRQGETVVVSAAAGGVGGLLVQLAAHSGARVIALAGSESKLDHARGLGADVALNYRERDWVAALVAATPDGLDIVFDGIGGDLTASLTPLVQARGRYLPHGAAGGRWGPSTNRRSQRAGSR